MINEIHKSSNIPVWIPIKDVCILLDLKEKTLKEHCRSGKYTYRVERHKHNSEYFIQFDSLPEDYKRIYLGEKKSEVIPYSEAPSWAKTQADKYITVLKLCDGLRGNDLKEFVNKWNIQNIDSISYSNIMKMRRRYKLEGISGLLN